MFKDLLEIVGGNLERIGQHVVGGIEQMVPFAGREALNAARKDIAHRGIADLRAEG